MARATFATNSMKSSEGIFLVPLSQCFSGGKNRLLPCGMKISSSSSSSNIGTNFGSGFDSDSTSVSEFSH